MSEPNGSQNKVQSKNSPTKPSPSAKPTYKNILLRPPPPVAEIYSILSEPGIVGDYKLEVLNSIYTDPFEEPFSLYPIQLLVEAEEEELRRLTNPKSLSYRTLYKTLKETALAVKANVIVFIGHVEVCVKYMDKIDLNWKPNPHFPTVILIVGCHSIDYVHEYNNKKELQDLNYYFLGFEDLVHVIDGVIYQCEHPHLSVPDMDCRYPGSEKDIEELLDPIDGTYNYAKVHNQASQNPLVQCMDAKFERFINVYKQDLNRRNCAKVTTEILIEKIKTLQTPDGSFKPHNQLTNEDMVLSRKEMVQCTTAQRCGITINTEANRIAEQFDEKMKEVRVYHEIKHLFGSLEFENDEEHRVNDEKLTSYLNSLPKDQVNTVLNIRVAQGPSFDEMPLYYYIFIYKYSITIKEILTKYKPDWFLRTKDNHSLVLNLIRRLENPKKEKSLRGLKYEYEYTYYTVKQLFRLFMKLHEKGITVFVTYDRFAYSPFVHLLRENFVYHLPLIKFYFKYIPGVTSSKSIRIDYNDLIDRLKTDVTVFEVFMDRAFPQGEDFRFVMEALFVHGIDPLEKNSKSQTPIASYEECVEKYLDPEILKLFFIYGGADKSYATKRVQFFEKLLANQYEFLDRHAKLKGNARYHRLRKGGNYEYSIYKEELFDFRADHLREFCRRAIDTYKEIITFLDTNDLSKLRKTPEDIERQLDIDLAQYIEGARAIPEIKEYYGMIQKFMKKQKIEPLLKQEMLEEVATIYKNKRELENEGNSAVRRLERMLNIFPKIKNTIRNYEPLPPKPPAKKQGGRRGKTRRRSQLKKRYTRRH